MTTRQHLSILPGKKASVFPPNFQHLLASLGTAVRTAKDPADLAARFLAILPTLAPATATAGRPEIARLLTVADRNLTPSPTTRRTILQALTDHPALPLAYNFHPDGFVRKAALRHMTHLGDAAFSLAAVMGRRNDWVPQVRRAADETWQRLLPTAPLQVMADAVPFLILRPVTWQRWDHASNPAQGLTDLPLAALLHYLLTHPSPLFKVLYQTLQTDVLDPHLESLLQARTTLIRKIALTVLLQGKAYWQIGRGWQWTDKSMWQRRPVPLWQSRTLTCAHDATAILACAAHDKNPLVRAVAVSHLTQHRP